MLQTTAMKLVYVGTATVNELVNQPVVTENDRLQSLQECKTFLVIDSVDELDEARNYHTTSVNQPAAFFDLPRRTTTSKCTNHT